MQTIGRRNSITSTNASPTNARSLLLIILDCEAGAVADDLLLNRDRTIVKVDFDCVKAVDGAMYSIYQGKAM